VVPTVLLTFVEYFSFENSWKNVKKNLREFVLKNILFSYAEISQIPSWWFWKLLLTQRSLETAIVEFFILKNCYGQACLNCTNIKIALCRKRIYSRRVKLAAPLLVLCGPNRYFHYATVLLYCFLTIISFLVYKNTITESTKNVIKHICRYFQS